ncbi:hypothetical protein PFICI_10132 [Pestalotiopsis fici W106-1]|uniref:Uncharacterized protein n=1 Tax=Pestalotiopsis fici (strain W106-1 / CGMCC3.15140) TaxID=1229662 RepID=W3WW37_PESFW|nr:uncharacterized protein PFICI_10132 [Pestalotiopsis fici W106-1]ETS78070.1 hypothetical protein PFICI_10132 [Pestalotiopsis fici W106-1]
MKLSLVSLFTVASMASLAFALPQACPGCKSPVTADTIVERTPEPVAEPVVALPEIEVRSKQACPGC